MRHSHLVPLGVAALACVALLTGCATTALPAALPGVGTLPEPASAWPAAQYDARHSSGTPAVGPITGHVQWTAELGGNLTPGTVIGTDGSILQAGNDGVLHALDPATGKERWRLDGGGGSGGDLSTSPAVLADGTLLWPGPSALIAVSAAGKELWRVAFPGQVLSPVVGGRNRVYVADLTGRLVALVVTHTSHRTAWKLDLGGPDYAGPAVAPDGTITTASGKQLIGVRDTGDRGVVAWRFDAKRLIEVSNGVGPDGTVVLGTNGDMEYGIRADGTKAWAIDIRSFTYSSSAVRPDGKAYFADNPGVVRVIDTKDGHLDLRLQPSAPRKEHVWTSVVADAKGNLYFASTTGHAYGYTAAGKRLFDVTLPSGSDSYPALGADGTLYIATIGGTLVAIGP